MADTDRGGGRPDNPYCAHCTDPTGKLKSREEVREGMIAFYMQSMGKSREEAEREVDVHMAIMPAWSSGGQTPTAAEPTGPAAPESVPGPAPIAPELTVPAPEPAMPPTPAENVPAESAMPPLPETPPEAMPSTEEISSAVPGTGPAPLGEIPDSETPDDGNQAPGGSTPPAI